MLGRVDLLGNEPAHVTQIEYLCSTKTAQLVSFGQPDTIIILGQ